MCVCVSVLVGLPYGVEQYGGPSRTCAVPIGQVDGSGSDREYELRFKVSQWMTNVGVAYTFFFLLRWVKISFGRKTWDTRQSYILLLWLRTYFKFAFISPSGPQTFDKRLISGATGDTPLRVLGGEGPPTTACTSVTAVLINCIIVNYL